MPLDLSWTQSLREQRAPKGDQGVEGQGGLWRQAGLAPPPRWVALEEPLNSLICKSRTVRPTFTLRINKMSIRKGPTQFSPSLVRNWLCFPLWPFSGCETAALCRVVVRGTGPGAGILAWVSALKLTSWVTAQVSSVPQRSQLYINEESVAHPHSCCED